MSPSLSSVLIDKIRKGISRNLGSVVFDKIIEKEVLDTLFHKNSEQLLISPDVLKDIKVQSSSYGKTIPKIYGTARISGNIIWASPIRYTQHRRGGSKLSSKTLSTEYKATLAIAICEGPVHELLKIWANGRPVDLTKIRYHFYQGTEEQNQNPIILVETKSSPAYRGLSYIVIEDFPLRAYNNSIPNFVFEVTSYPSEFLRNHITKKITCIHTVGFGEFTYDTQLHKSINISDIRGKEIPSGKATSINGKGNTAFAISSLNSLRATLPNVQWVAVPVHWFSDSTNIEECHIYPAATNLQNVKTLPGEWHVGRFAVRNTLRVPNIYPGTANDASLVRYLRDLKLRNYKIMLSLKLIVIGAADAQLQCREESSGLVSDPSIIDRFFMDQYHEFLEHYSILTRGLIDALVIGENFSNLTRIQDKSGEFPAVASLIKLAAFAKRTSGSKVIVTYAANWDEYHSHDGVYNMDALWASDNIDVVGIKAYFPLTDGNALLSSSDFEQAWKSGEGYSYFYDGKDRQRKIPFKSELVAWKNIKYWWENSHISEGVHDTLSKWVPSSKKIWFIEYGFRSTESCTDFQLLSGYDHSMAVRSSSSAEKCSFSAQRIAIENSLNMWESSNMVEKMFLYMWDIGFSDPSSISVDCYEKWKTGYSINRKIDAIPASAILQDVLRDIPEASVKCADTSVSGYLINNKKSIYEALVELQQVYSFGIKEGAIEILASDTHKTVEVSEQDIVSEVHSTMSTAENLYNPTALSYISLRHNYQPRLVRSPIGTSNTANVRQIPIVLDDEQAKHMLDAINHEMLREKLMFKMVLTLKYVNLRVGDIIAIRNYTIQVTDIKTRNFLVHIEGITKLL